MFRQLDLVFFIGMGMFSFSVLASDWGCGSYRLGDGSIDFSPCLSVNAGVGFSHFSPGVKETSWEVDDDNDVGWRVSVDYHFAKYFFTELVYADLGELQASNTNTLITEKPVINYKTPALFGAFIYPTDFWGVEPFVKLGVAKVNIATDSDLLTLEDQSSAQLGWGVGVRKMLSRHIAVRADFESFSEDTSLTSVSVAYVFGSSPVSVAQAAAPEPLSVEPESEVATAKQLCPKQFARVTEQNHCVLKQSSLESSQFASAEYQLTDAVLQQLQEYVERLNQFEQTNIVIVGHTDSVGSDRYNQELSEKRAKSVYQYFVEQGIEPERLSFKGLGEKEPVADNNTKEGRAQNRRVVLMVQNAIEPKGLKPESE